MTLTSPAISATDFEKSVNDLWLEFLENWFDGQTHNVGRFQNVEFPECNIAFQQSPIVQGENKPDITITWLTNSTPKCVWDLRRDGSGEPDKVAEDRMSWIMWVRASGENRRLTCRNISDKLYLLMNNRSATKSLVEKGMYGVESTTPMLIGSRRYDDRTGVTSYDMRHISVSAWVRFEKGLMYE